MKKIVILNGAGKKNGNTAAMINAFKTGAAENEVAEMEGHRHCYERCRSRAADRQQHSVEPFNDLPHNLIIPAPFNYSTTF